MGYLNNTKVVVDAILTKKGKELLSKGRDLFNITKFALADDEIDYGLWNPAHPLGTNFYGIIIDNMPILEATPDETQTMRYKLVTLPKNTARIPVVQIGATSVTLQAAGDVHTTTPNTSNFEGGNTTLGYTAILSDSDVADIRISPGKEVKAGSVPTVPVFIGSNESKRSVSIVGFGFEIIAKRQPLEDATATVTIIGNETGGQVTLTVTVKKETTATARRIAGV